MIFIFWLKGLFIRRGGRIAGAIVGIAVTVSLLASIGSFIVYNNATMTARAISDVPVDWQIQMTPGADAGAVVSALGDATPYKSLETVAFADTSGFETKSADTIQTTGPGKALGISDSYFKTFPAQMRPLLGASTGVLVAQQTAANLHVKVGDKVSIQRVGLPPVDVAVDGIIDLPNADSLFQAIGLPAGAAPQAPPDNVLLLPMALWHQLFDPQAVARPDSVRQQLHVAIGHTIPADPSLAYLNVKQKSNNLEARIAGSAIVGDNLAARLSAVREDALYAKVLFLFLGLPGAMLALLMTLFITSSGAKHRGQEQAVLRIHGASVSQIMQFAVLEAAAMGVCGAALGVLLSLATMGLMIPSGTPLGGLSVPWVIVSAFMGLLIAVSAVLIPAWRQARTTSAIATKPIGSDVRPLWHRAFLDIIFLALAAVEFWRTASTGYKVVLAPEGVAAISVNYEAFIAPFFLWIGAVLLSTRFYRLGLGRWKGLLSRLIKPVAGKLSGFAAASMSRESRYIIRGIILVSLAVSFAVSTAIFNTTYNTQARVDAELTNGADVTITGLVPFQPGDGRLAAIKAVSGIEATQLMQHRFAYVGNDLQDIYGIDPSHIAEATNISNAFFEGGNAKATLNNLASQKDGVLVSAETVNDYQLKPGDSINLRLQDGRDHQYHVIPFHFIGIIREFPTAPRDSFLVANASYISEMTANAVPEIALARTSKDPAAVAKAVSASLNSTDVQVSDLTNTQRIIGSSLTSVDLHGLTAMELAYAALLVAGAMGLVLALGMAERRRNFAILRAIGAKSRQLDAFIWSEALLVLCSGGFVGVLLGTGVAQMLVMVLTGVFDPPPEALSIPWAYLAVLAACSILSMLAAVFLVKRMSKRPVVEELRNL